MHFDIVEAIRAKQRKEQKSVRIENGDLVDISTSDGQVVVRLSAPPAHGHEEEIAPAETVPPEILEY